MRRSSVVGPILLIAIGVLFLLRNMLPGLRLMEFVSMYWPYLLILWGVLRLLEVVFWNRNGRIPKSGVSGGEWALIVVLCVLGTAFFWGIKRRPWLHSQISAGAWELMGESHEYPVSGTLPAAANSRIIIDNPRGNIRVTGGDTLELRVSGSKSIRAMNRAEADDDDRRTPLQLLPQGDSLLVRTNLERVGPGPRIRTDLELTVPKSARVDIRSRYGDVDMENVGGDVEIASENAGIRLHNMGGNVRADLHRSDIIRIVNAAGTVSLKGRGQELELENIAGVVNVNGSYSGDLSFRKLPQGLRLENSATNFRVEQLPGVLRFSMGRVVGNQIVGPSTLRGRSKDVELSDFTEAMTVDVERGDIILRPAAKGMGRIEVKTRSGEIDLALPPSAAFELAARVRRGEIQNDFGTPLKLERQDRGQSLDGRVGSGPRITLETDRGEIRVRKASPSGEPQRTLPPEGERRHREDSVPSVPPMPPVRN